MSVVSHMFFVFLKTVEKTRKSFFHSNHAKMSIIDLAGPGPSLPSSHGRGKGRYL